MPEDRPAAGDDGIDFDRAWQELLTSLTSEPAGTPTAPPADPYDVLPAAAGTADGDGDDETDDESARDVADDDHFVPPPAPPLPMLRPVTLLGIGAIVVGILVLALRVEGGRLAWAGVLAILGGTASLIYNMRSGPPTDSGWDDGAVL